MLPMLWAVTSFSCVLVPVTAAARRRSCGPRAAQTVGSSPTIRFYHLPHRSRYAPDFEYACWRGGHGRFVVSPTGSLGWWGWGGAIDRKRQYTGPQGIWTVDDSGEHLIEAPEELSEQGLTWAGGNLYWTADGRAHSLPLP